MDSVERVIRGGLLVDGSGTPPRRADVGIGGGRVIDVGSDVSSQGTEIIEADGLVVMPGIVDTHTHYDPQLTFDPYATSACFHGVTSVITGLCGFSIAPCRPEDRDFLTGFFAAVEGMSRSVLDTALAWTWEGFDQFLAGLKGCLGVNMAMYAGHSSIRRYIMGESASEREATADEVASMSSIVRDAVKAGAAGFASAQLAADRDQFGDPVASAYATFDEIAALGAEAKQSQGSIAYLPASAVDGIDQRDQEFLLRLAAVSGLPVIIQGMGWRPGMDAMWESDQIFFEEAAQSNAKVYSSYRTQPYTRPFTWAQGTSLYDGVFHWRDLTKMPGPDRLRLLADPEQRAEFCWALDNPNTDGSKGSNLPPPPPSRTFVERSASAPQAEGRSLSDLAQQQGSHPAAVMADISVADGLDTLFVWRGEDEAWRRGTAEALRHPNLLVGLSDGGAHADRDDGSEWSTYFLATWLLEREVLPLEEGVRRITSVPAQICGLADRGVIAPGYAADMVLFDPQTLALGAKSLVSDLPGDSRRWQVRPEGIHQVIVNGQTIVKDGTVTGALPGQVLRPQRTPSRTK